MIRSWKRLPALAVAACVLLAGCSSDDGPLVGYDVTGTGETDVTYYDGEKSVTEHVKLPWHKEFRVDKKKFTLRVQAGAPGQSGVEACAASVDNQQVVHATAMNPAFQFVLCSHEYEAK